MLKQIKLEEARGKVVKEAREAIGYESAAIVFEDGTFLAFEAEKEYYDDNESLNCNPQFNMKNSDDIHKMRSLGIISQEEHDKYEEECTKKWEADKREHNRRLLQQLKEKEQRGEL
jgi:hypothetical protein